jgi:RHS repeat-associated protein
MKSILKFLVLLTSIAQAQNIPNNSGYPTGTVTPVLPPNFTSGIKVNYIRTTIPSVPVTTESAIQPTDPSQSKVSTQYLDGLGRPIQTVEHFASPYQNDMVNVTKYDNLGRDAWHFLPYTKTEAAAVDNGKFKLTPYTDQKYFYQNDLAYDADNYFYTQNNFEPSPLNRVIKSMSQGNSWVGRGKGKTITEIPLPSASNIFVFTIGYTTGSLPTTSEVYGTGELMVKTTTDEDNNFIAEYTTKDNHLVLKTTGKVGNPTKLQTYYIYDDFGMLRYIIPPKATALLAANGWQISPTVAAELCFGYEYDGRFRIIVKTIPGAGKQYMVYNQKDELIFSQTPIQQAKGEWMFNKYDILGRLIQTGVYNSTATQATLQNYANTPYTGADPLLQYIFKDIYGNTAYINSFTTAKILTTNYYDDYSFTTRAYDASFMNSLPLGWNTNVSKETTNLLTGTKTIVLDGAVTPTELVSVNFYNDKGLLLQSQAQNHKGGWNMITNSYDFLNQKLGTYTELNNPAATDNAKIKTIEVFTYDHTGRLTGISHSINDLNAQVSAANYNYDELGRLANKNYSNGMIPSVEYEYNIRGWLTGINKNYCLYYTTSNLTFGMEIDYDYGYTTNYLNGSIAGIKWRNSGKSSELRSYGYTYDTYNRLKSGDFVMQVDKNNTTLPWSSTTKDYTASNMSYDENGNLLGMKQMGLNSAGQKIVLDDMAYSYNTTSNKLKSITESATSQSKSPTTYDNLGDFRDVAGATDYTYDLLGNLLTDANKSLSFTYDEIIDKTKRVTKGTQNADYLYDSRGNKLQKKVSPGTVTTTDYINGAVYINNSLSFVSHADGRIRYNGAATTKYMYDYFIKDHLGNTRSIVTYTSGPITGFAKTASAPSNVTNYIATSEPANAAKENQLFDNIDNTRAIKPSNKTSIDNYVAKISSKNSKTILGPDITLKVMAGDTVKISAEALYIPETNNLTNVAKNVTDNFITAFTTIPSLAAEGINTIANSNTKELAASILNMQKKNTVDGAPKAFLNYVLYDQYMNLIPEASGALQIKNKDGWQTLETDKIAIPESGFLRVFSNNMEASPVSINNTTVGLISGKIVEEYNYYPYGLVFDQTLKSSTPIPKTNYLYNGKELQRNEFGDGNGLELVDYGARMYDSQIGRWHAVDMLAEKFNPISPYNYAIDNPINIVDVDGKDVYVIVWATAGGEIGHAALAVSNYRAVETKTMVGGHEVTKTEYVPNGTFTYYDLWPGGPGAGKENFDQNVDGIYQKKDNLTWNNLFNEDPSGGEMRPADGIVKIDTKYEDDQKAIAVLDQRLAADKPYNGETNNCTDNTKAGLEAAVGQNVSAIETVKSGVEANTPNYLFKSAEKLPNASVLKSPGNKVDNGFVEGATGPLIGPVLQKKLAPMVTD